MCLVLSDETEDETEIETEISNCCESETDNRLCSFMEWLSSIMEPSLISDDIFDELSMIDQNHKIFESYLKGRHSTMFVG